MELAPYAVSGKDFCEREFKETSHPYRSEFQRDRDRIVHSRAFRRLEYKTQVFVNHLGDNFRTRLTHSIEVSQIARTVARSLKLNEDLTETIALSHDLGHPPFGHAGERALHREMKDFGGFDHNDQSLRIVTKLEHRYPEFEGLNLTHATRVGLQKHSKLVQGVGHSLETQVVDLCDEIAYNNHDLDDGIEAGHLNIQKLKEVEIWKFCWEKVNSQYPSITEKIAVRHTIHEMINIMVTDLIDNTAKNLKENNITTVADVLSWPEEETDKLVSFSSDISLWVSRLKKYLFQNLYRHPDVVAMNVRAEKIVKRMFEFFSNNPHTMPNEYWESQEEAEVYRSVADFISGMTDRYALHWNKIILGVDG
ncbi:MAG: deoxyguanosinetriphosphate triphosphohydrolase [Leptospirales bacterium]